DPPVARPPAFAAAIDPRWCEFLRARFSRPCRHRTPAGPAWRRGQTILRIGQYNDTYSVNSFRTCRQRDMGGKMMKKRGLALCAWLPAGAGGYWAFEANKYRIPGLLQDCNAPVQPNRAVAWQQGPATAPEGKRPPNIIL